MTKTCAVSSTVLLALVALAGPALAEKTGAPATSPGVPAGPPLPEPSKELEAFMKGFEGSWKCETKFPAGAMGPGSAEGATKATVVFKKEFGGMSWHGQADVQKSKTSPALTVVFQLGWEPGSKQATFVSYDSMGGAVLGSGPLAGDSVVFSEEGFMMGSKLKARETLTKKGPKEFFHKLEVDMGKGFQSMGEDTCKK
jgi:hypothetical protein